MPTPSDATKRAYKQRFDGLFIRFEGEAKKQSAGTTPQLERFIEWLLAQRPTLRPATWRQYRAAVNFQLTIAPAATQRSRERIGKALAALQIVDTEEARNAREKLPLRTSARKLKGIVVDDQTQIFDHLASTPTRNSDRLRTYLVH